MIFHCKLDKALNLDIYPGKIQILMGIEDTTGGMLMIGCSLEELYKRSEKSTSTNSFISLWITCASRYRVLIQK